MELSDVFIFLERFDYEIVIQFREKFLKHFKSIDEYFEYPKYSQNTIFETDSFEEMFSFILEQEGRAFTFYFQKDSFDIVRQGIIQINSNGSMCLALSVIPKDEEFCLQQLKINYPDFPVYISNNIPLPTSLESLPH